MHDVVRVVVAFESDLVQHMLSVIQTKNKIRAVVGLIRSQHHIIVAHNCAVLGVIPVLNH